VAADDPIPDLVVIDGGKGQLGAARHAMESAGVSDVALVALAKREEEVFVPGSAEPLIFDRRSAGLRWLMRARDEAHRFAIEYNRKLRRRRTLTSGLSDVEGVGPAREKALLREFGSLKAVREATVRDLMRVPGVGRVTAQRILETLAETGGKSGRRSAE
jgi:excinuclease ABC subunit C